MTRGVSFEIPNEYGRYLMEILKPINISSFDWYSGGEEAYVANGSEMGPLFHGEIFGLGGSELKRILAQSNQYVIFANLKAFPKGQPVIDVLNYAEFLNSNCQLVLLVVDSSYVTIYCKEEDVLEKLYLNAINSCYEKVRYITDENDFRTKLSVW